MVGHKVVAHQLTHPGRQLGVVIGHGVKPLIQFSPVQAAHLGINIVKFRVHPVNHCVEISPYLIDIGVAAVLTHVAVDIALAHPGQSSGKEILTIGDSLDIRLPLLDVGILGVAELSLAQRHKWPAIDGIQLLLRI